VRRAHARRTALRCLAFGVVERGTRGGGMSASTGAVILQHLLALLVRSTGAVALARAMGSWAPTAVKSRLTSSGLIRPYYHVGLTCSAGVLAAGCDVASPRLRRRRPLVAARPKGKKPGEITAQRLSRCAAAALRAVVWRYDTDYGVRAVRVVPVRYTTPRCGPSRCGLHHRWRRTGRGRRCSESRNDHQRRYGTDHLW
jgi:hypothetical protein